MLPRKIVIALILFQFSLFSKTYCSKLDKSTIEEAVNFFKSTTDILNRRIPAKQYSKELAKFSERVTGRILTFKGLQEGILKIIGDGEDENLKELTEFVEEKIRIINQQINDIFQHIYYLPDLVEEELTWEEFTEQFLKVNYVEEALISMWNLRTEVSRIQALNICKKYSMFNYISFVNSRLINNNGESTFFKLITKDSKLSTLLKAGTRIISSMNEALFYYTQCFLLEHNNGKSIELESSLKSNTVSMIAKYSEVVKLIAEKGNEFASEKNIFRNVKSEIEEVFKNCHNESEQEIADNIFGFLSYNYYYAEWSVLVVKTAEIDTKVGIGELKHAIKIQRYGKTVIILRSSMVKNHEESFDDLWEYGIANYIQYDTEYVVPHISSKECDNMQKVFAKYDNLSNVIVLYPNIEYGFRQGNQAFSTITTVYYLRKKSLGGSEIGKFYKDLSECVRNEILPKMCVGMIVIVSKVKIED